MDKIKVIINNNQKNVKIPTGLRMLVRRCCNAVLRNEGFEGSIEISVTFVNNEQIKDLNYKVKEAGVIYEMLGYNNEVTHEEYRNLMKYYFGETLYNYVYKKISK